MNQISKEERLALHKYTEQGDYPAAAKYYTEATGIPIRPNYLSRFMRGDREGSVKIQRKHQPLEMYAAVAKAIRQRTEAKLSTTSKAANIRKKLIQTIKNDTKPQLMPA